MSESILKYRGHEIVTDAKSYGDVHDSDKCRLCGCSWSAAEMLSECEGRARDALNEHLLNKWDGVLRRLADGEEGEA